MSLVDQLADVQFENRRDALRRLAKMSHGELSASFDSPTIVALNRILCSNWRKTVDLIHASPKDARLASELKFLAPALAVVAPGTVVAMFDSLRNQLAEWQLIPESTKSAIKKELDRAQVIATRELSGLHETIHSHATTGDQAVLCERATVALYCRRGLEELTLEAARIGGLSAREGGPGLVLIAMRGDSNALSSGPFSALTAIRYWHDAGFVFTFRPGWNLAQIADWLASDVGPLLVPFGVRARFDWGESRAANWEFAAALTQARSLLVNAPRQADWEMMLDRPAGRLVAKPRFKSFDLRFDWREKGVPASSHAPLAAALAALAKIQSGEVVWDPFCGAGTEIIEGALAQTGATFIGSDLDPVAVDSAKHNARLAGVKAEWVPGDFRERGSSLNKLDIILTNPPLGRRVATGDAVALADALIDLAAERLTPGSGRLVWIPPDRHRALQRVRQLGFQVAYLKSVDLGGFDGEIQVLIKRNNC